MLLPQIIVSICTRLGHVWLRLLLCFWKFSENETKHVNWTLPISALGYAQVSCPQTASYPRHKFCLTHVCMRNEREPIGLPQGLRTSVLLRHVLSFVAKIPSLPPTLLPAHPLSFSPFLSPWFSLPFYSLMQQALAEVCGNRDKSRSRFIKELLVQCTHGHVQGCRRWKMEAWSPGQLEYRERLSFKTPHVSWIKQGLGKETGSGLEVK